MSTSSPDGRGAGTAEQLFHELVGLPPGEREAYLARVCPADHESALRAEVLELLQGHEEAGGFLPYETVTGPLFRRPADLLPESPGDRIGPYKLMEQIGEGGFGVVWVAEQEKPVRRRVALKVLKPGMDTKQVVARFEQERQALALMDHPNIARVLDAGATPHGRPFFVMELVKGLKITEYCDQAQLPTGDRLRLFIAVCQAVQHAHQKGIIHRDIKPSNILVTLHDGVPVPKVIDFGVAKATQQQRLTDLTLYTQFEQMVGTPLYMSPEQAEMSGLDIDTRSDIYSLGVLLYELLTGRTPFDPATLMKRGLEEIRRAVREQEPQKPSTFVGTLALDLRTDLARQRQTDSARLVGQIRGDLDWIVMKALEKDRNRRYENATGFAQDIQRHLGSEPVQARPPSTGYRFRRFAKRNKVAFTTGIAIAAALLTGTSVSLWQASRANAALAELRASAPAFAEQARALAAQDKFDEAIEKLDFAIKLRPDVADYVLAKADLLQSQLRLSEAAPLYLAALRLSPGSDRAQANLDLCRSLAEEAAEQPKLSRESLARLLQAIRADGRPTVQMMHVSRLLGEEKKVLLDYWMERLKDLPIPPNRPLKNRLLITEDGGLHLDLRTSSVTDISLLREMPLRSLFLSGCPAIRDLSPLEGIPLEILELGQIDLENHSIRPACGVHDLSPLRGMPLKFLNLRNTQVKDLSPLQGMPLTDLNLSDTQVTDLSPLRGMPLEILHLDRTRVLDINSLKGMTLKWLSLTETAIRDLSPLRGMPLTSLALHVIPALDFSALADCPLEYLALASTQVGDLYFLRNMPLETLYLSDCNKARGLEVLAEIETLEVLTLPDFAATTYPPEELKAIAKLHSHPRLEHIQLGTGIGGRRNSITLKAEFWASFDDLLRPPEVLAQVPGGKPFFKSLPDRTWSVSFSGQKVSDISALAASPISELNVEGTQISSLTALKGMPLKKLFLGNTSIADLEDLKEHYLTDLYLNDCQHEIDLSPLAGMTSLETLALPPNPLNLDKIRHLPKLKYISFNYIPERHTARQYWQKAETFWDDLPVEILARAGMFEEAEALLRRQAGSLNSMNWLSLGLVVLAQGDNTRFRAFCSDMMSHKKSIEDVTFARVALISPDHGAAGAEVNGIMEIIRALKPHRKETLAFIVKGMVEYRDGQYAKAAEILTPVTFEILPGRVAVAQVLRSMAFHRNGEFEASQRDLTKAREAIARNWPRRTTTGSWHDWLIAHLLLQEAEKLMADPGLPALPASR